MDIIDEARLRRVIRENEGVRYQVYKDSEGHLTAGIGHLLPDDVLPEGHAVSPEMVEQWFEADLRGACSGAERLCDGAWDGMTDIRREVMIDAVFQLGAGGLAKFAKMMAAVKAGNWGIAAVEHLDSKGARQTPRRFMRRAKAMLYQRWGRS